MRVGSLTAGVVQLRSCRSCDVVRGKDGNEVLQRGGRCTGRSRSWPESAEWWLSALVSTRAVITSKFCQNKEITSKGQPQQRTPTQQRPEDLTRFGSRHTSVFVRISMCHALCRRRKQRRWPQAAGERQMVRDAHRRQRQRLRGDVAGDGVRVRRVHTVRLRRQTQQTKQTHARSSETGENQIVDL